MVASTRKQKRKDDRERRKARSSGPGVARMITDDNKAPQKTKFLFDDDGNAEGALQANDLSNTVESNGNDVAIRENANDGGDESDDDAVEEVSGGTARAEALVQREAERKTRKTKKKKKHKSAGVKAKGGANEEKAKERRGEKVEEADANAEADPDDELLTEEFFSMVDSERAVKINQLHIERKRQKRAKNIPVGRHTTFVVGDGEVVTSSPVQVGHNIEVIALAGGGAGSDNNEEGSLDVEAQKFHIASTLGTEPSKAAVAFARGRLLKGSSAVRKTTSGKKGAAKEQAWKRSRKMTTYAKVNRRVGTVAAKHAFIR